MLDKPYNASLLLMHAHACCGWHAMNDAVAVAGRLGEHGRHRKQGPTRHPAQKAQQQVNAQLKATALHHSNSNWGQQERHQCGTAVSGTHYYFDLELWSGCACRTGD
jgi:hypothetical protein